MLRGPQGLSFGPGTSTRFFEWFWTASTRGCSSSSSASSLWVLSAHAERLWNLGKSPPHPQRMPDNMSMITLFSGLYGPIRHRPAHPAFRHGLAPQTYPQPLRARLCRKTPPDQTRLRFDRRIHARARAARLQLPPFRHDHPVPCCSWRRTLLLSPGLSAVPQGSVKFSTGMGKKPASGFLGLHAGAARAGPVGLRYAEAPRSLRA